MANQERVLSQTEVLISELQNARKILQEESSDFKRIDLEELKNSIFLFENSIAEDSAGIKEIFNAVTASRDNRTRLVQEALAKSPSQDEREKIAISDKFCAAIERELLDKASTVSIKIINDVVKDIQESAKRISIATRKVEAAFKKIDDFNKQIGLLKSLIDIFSAVITAFTNGVPALIGTLLDQVDTLTAQFSD